MLSQAEGFETLTDASTPREPKVSLGGPSAGVQGARQANA